MSFCSILILYPYIFRIWLYFLESVTFFDHFVCLPDLNVPLCLNFFKFSNFFAKNDQFFTQNLTFLSDFFVFCFPKPQEKKRVH